MQGTKEEVRGTKWELSNTRYEMRGEKYEKRRIKDEIQSTGLELRLPLLARASRS